MANRDIQRQGRELELESLLTAERLKLAQNKTNADSLGHEVLRYKEDNVRLTEEVACLQHNMNRMKSIYGSEMSLAKRTKERLEIHFNNCLEEYKNKLRTTEEKLSYMQDKYKQEIETLKSDLATRASYANNISRNAMTLELEIQRLESHNASLKELLSEAEKSQVVEVKRKCDTEIQRKDDDMGNQASKILDMTRQIEMLQSKVETLVGDHNQLVEEKNVLKLKLESQESQRHTSYVEEFVNHTAFHTEKQFLTSNLEERNRMIEELTDTNLKLESEIGSYIETILEMQSNISSIKTDCNLEVEKAQNQTEVYLNLFRKEEKLRLKLQGEKEDCQSMITTLLSQKEMISQDNYDVCSSLKQEQRMQDIVEEFRKGIQTLQWKIQELISERKHDNVESECEYSTSSPTDVEMIMLKEEIKRMKQDSSKQNIAHYSAKLHKREKEIEDLKDLS